MTSLFLFCAIVGGTLLLCQLVMTLMGIASFESPHAGGFDSPAMDGHLADLIDPSAGEPGTDAHHSSWLFGILSYQTIVAATTFFGMAGMLAERSGASLTEQLLSATMGGGAAMVGVHWLLRSMHSLGQSGTLSVTNAIGRSGTVSVPIPGDNAGTGKVLLEIQGRLEELHARTAQPEKIATGSQVLVVGVSGGNLLEVEPNPADSALSPPDSVPSMT